MSKLTRLYKKVNKRLDNITYWKGDLAYYTGKKEYIHGGLFYEVKLLEGHLKGQSKWTQKGN